MEPDVYYIDFNTKINPGRLESTQVSIGVHTFEPHEFDHEIPINLCDHPLYANLEKYVLANPSSSR